MSTTEQATVTFDSAIPILRMFDERKAREFYLDFLGFSVEFEHRFEADLPLYLGISRNGLHLHLSEHHGDACPGLRCLFPLKTSSNCAMSCLASSTVMHDPTLFSRAGARYLKSAIRSATASGSARVEANAFTSADTDKPVIRLTRLLPAQ